MGFEHPYLVLTAGVLCLPAALYLARFFFHSLAEFADDAGLSTPGESLFSAFLTLDRRVLQQVRFVLFQRSWLHLVAGGSYRYGLPCSTLF